MNIGFLERVYLRGLEGMIADKFLGQVVSNEWRNANDAEEALRNQFEAKYMGEQLFFRMKGLGL